MDPGATSAGRREATIRTLRLGRVAGAAAGNGAPYQYNYSYVLDDMSSLAVTQFDVGGLDFTGSPLVSPDGTATLTASGGPPETVPATVLLSDGISVTGSGAVAPIPEPASVVLLGTGLLALGGSLKRKLFS